MNYLAHLALSGSDEELMAGNFMGDSLRGVDIHAFPKKIQEGIALHRLIDHFTDHHPVFIRAKKVFAGQFDKYSGALTDVCFDHFLGKDFSFYFGKDLQEFAFSCYRATGKYYFLFPEKAKQFYQYMVQNNILFSYSKAETLEKVFTGMTYRINERAPLFMAYPVFLEHYNELAACFAAFFPELMDACSEFLRRGNSPAQL